MHTVLAAFTMVFLSELGDKSQLLAIAFASRFQPWLVMLGISLATLVNQGLAVAVGTLLASVIPMNAVRIAAGILFILFGLWTLRGGEEEDEEERECRFGPLLTIVLTYFLAEMGDRTQLATIALAADLSSPAAVLAGTAAAMIAADGLGVLLGDFICKRVPPRVMQVVSASVFLIFGAISIFQALA